MRYWCAAKRWRAPRSAGAAFTHRRGTSSASQRNTTHKTPHKPPPAAQWYSGAKASSRALKGGKSRSQAHPFSGSACVAACAKQTTQDVDHATHADLPRRYATCRGQLQSLASSHRAPASSCAPRAARLLRADCGARGAPSVGPFLQVHRQRFARRTKMRQQSSSGLRARLARRQTALGCAATSTEAETVSFMIRLRRRSGGDAYGSGRCGAQQQRRRAPQRAWRETVCTGEASRARVRAAWRDVEPCRAPSLGASRRCLG